MKKKTSIIVAIVILIIAVLGILGYMYIKPYFTLKKFQDKIFAIQSQESNYKINITVEDDTQSYTIVESHRDNVSTQYNFGQTKLYNDGEKAYYLNLLDKSKVEIEDCANLLIGNLNNFWVVTNKNENTIINLIKEVPNLKVTKEEFNSKMCYKIYLGDEKIYQYIFVDADSFEPVAGVQKSTVNNVEKITTYLFEISYNTVTDEDVKLDF